MNYLVVSKHAKRRETMKSLIRQVDRRAQAHDAHDWDQAEHALRRETRDLVLADMMTGEDHGAALQLLQHRPEAIIAILSKDRDTSVATLLLQAGVRGVIPQDLDWRATIRALDLILLGGYYIPAHALRLVAPRRTQTSVLEVAERAIPYRRRIIDPTALSPRQQQISYDWCIWAAPIKVSRVRWASAKERSRSILQPRSRCWAPVTVPLR